jgi:hypothetical protein
LGTNLYRETTWKSNDRHANRKCSRLLIDL